MGRQSSGKLCILSLHCGKYPAERAVGAEQVSALLNAQVAGEGKPGEVNAERHNGIPLTKSELNKAHKQFRQASRAKFGQMLKAAGRIQSG